MQARYEVTTWDTQRQAFTPQVGVSCGPHTIHGLKRALRKLQGMGYDVWGCSRYAVRVERI